MKLVLIGVGRQNEKGGELRLGESISKLPTPVTVVLL